MGLTIPINGLQWSLTGGVNDYHDFSFVPDTMEMENERVTANTYRMVGPTVRKNTDFLGIITKVSCTWEELTWAQYLELSRIFYKNRFFYLRHFNPNPYGDTYYRGEYDCGNLKFGVKILGSNGIPTTLSNVSLNFTQRESEEL